MDELDRGGQLDVVAAAIAAEPGGGDREQRPDPLAARADEMRRHLGDARRVLGRHPGRDQPPDGIHVARERFREAFGRAKGRGVGHAVSVSTRGALGHMRAGQMKELLRTNDPTVIAFASALLDGEGIDWFLLDANTSILEGSIGILPRRMMVADHDLFLARATLRDNEISVSP